LHLRTRMHWIGSMGGYSADPELEQRYRGICPECGANTKVQLLAHKDKLLNFSATQRSYASTEFALHVPGHTGTRKGLFDGVLCGALPLLASDFTPLPFPSVVAYNEFALREMANVSRVVTKLQSLPRSRIIAMRRALLQSRKYLDYEHPSRALIQTALREILRVSRDGAHRDWQLADGSARTPLNVDSSFMLDSAAAMVPGRRRSRQSAA